MLVRSNRQAAVGFIFITMLVDVMGLGLIIPVMPRLIAALKQLPVNQASAWGALLISSYAVMQFLFAPVIGNLSDRYGRRPVLLASMFGFGIDYIILALAPSFGWLFAGRLIAGITGASFTTGAAYIADVSTPDTRARNFGMIGAAFGLGFIIGPALGGLLSGLGLRAPFYAAAILCLLNALYGYFILPESLPRERRRSFEWRRANPFGSLQFLRTTRGIGALAICYFLIYLAAQAVQGNWSYYTIYKFHWTETLVGLSLAVVGLLVAGVQAGLTRVVNPVLGNERSIYGGLLLYALGLSLFAIAAQGWMMFLFLVPYCMGGIAGPALQAVMAAHVPGNKQGELQGALTSLMSLTTIVGPQIMNNLFEYFTASRAPFHFPGMPFLLGALLMVASAAIAWYVFKQEKKRPDQGPAAAVTEG